MSIKNSSNKIKTIKLSLIAMLWVFGLTLTGSKTEDFLDQCIISIIGLFIFIAASYMMVVFHRNNNKSKPMYKGKK